MYGFIEIVKHGKENWREREREIYDDDNNNRIEQNIYSIKATISLKLQKRVDKS